VLECVVNLSEGRDLDLIGAIAEPAGADLLDLHHDADHHRSVLTLVGVEAPRALATRAVERLDLRHHDGVHPRFGVVDVVPFVALGSSTPDDAIAARDEFCRWSAETLRVPCFRYGPERSLPDIRRHAFRDLAPDTGPDQPHPTAGAMAVGARPPLVAYNLWLDGSDLATARAVAARLRGPAVRALGLAVGARVQVSMNLVSPLEVGPADVYEQVRRQAPIARAELVGLVPAAVLDRVASSEWARLDLSEDATIEARLAARGRSID
jgi:glutamate formiminotransferase